MDVAIALTRQLLEQARVDAGHGLDHALAVVAHVDKALICTQHRLTKDERLAIRLAALLHDVDDGKFFTTTNNANARAICATAALPLLELVMQMIDLVSCSKNGNRPASPEWLLYPRWADRLEAIGKIGIRRCHEYTLHVGRPLMLPSTRLPADRAELEQIASPRRFVDYVASGGAVGSSSFIDHFYDKLLHIARFDTTNAYFVRKAKQRHETMVKFILQVDPSNLADQLSRMHANVDGGPGGQPETG